jgi:hypothetical protein
MEMNAYYDQLTVKRDCRGLESASDLANRFFDALGTLTGLTATSPGVPKDVSCVHFISHYFSFFGGEPLISVHSHSQTIEASSVLGKRDFA